MGGGFLVTVFLFCFVIFSIFFVFLVLVNDFLLFGDISVKS